MIHICECCGKEMVCLKCNPPAKRKLNPQAQAVKDCLDAYVAARASIKQPYPGVPPVGKVVQWLGQQPKRDEAVEMFQLKCHCAAMAHTFDDHYHPFPMTVPKFVEAIPKLNESWVADAQRNATKQAADPRAVELKHRADNCYRNTPCGGGGRGEACAYCVSTVKGSKR